MKRRVLLLLGAAGMSAASVVGTSAISATPAAATGNPNAAFGYVINLFGCVFGGLGNPPVIGDCLRDNLRGLLGTIGLPIFPSGNANNASAAPKAPGSNAPSLNLPANVTGFLRTLPPALQTTPVADAPTSVAPVRQLVPTPVLNRGLSTSAPSGASRISSSLPKVPTLSEISLFRISDNAPVNDSGAPISTADLLQLIALGAVGAAGVTAVTRRRMAGVRS